MATRNEIAAIAATEALVISGILAPVSTDPVPANTQSIVLLSSDEPTFWSMFQATREYIDGQPDPLDRWSVTALDRITKQLPDSTALFPFGGPPWQPFIDYANRSGQAWGSPVGLLVHAKMGLFGSYRAALALPYTVHTDDTPPSPCPTCTQPCKTACPVDAFAGGKYDVPKCKAHITSDQGIECRQGCLVRRACPVGQTRRNPAQSAFHMKAFV